MHYNEIARIFNEQVWKLNNILIVFSIGIIAFSIQTLEKDTLYNYVFALYISWGMFFLVFVSGIIRFLIMQKAMTLQAKKAYDKEIEKIDVLNTTPEIQQTSHQNHILYIIMLVCFFIGLFAYAFFKIGNVL